MKKFEYLNEDLSAICEALDALEEEYSPALELLEGIKEGDQSGVVGESDENGAAIPGDWNRAELSIVSSTLLSLLVNNDVCITPAMDRYFNKLLRNLTVTIPTEVALYDAIDTIILGK